MRLTQKKILTKVTTKQALKVGTKYEVGAGESLLLVEVPRGLPTNFLFTEFIERFWHGPRQGQNLEVVSTAKLALKKCN